MKYSCSFFGGLVTKEAGDLGKVFFLTVLPRVAQSVLKFFRELYQMQLFFLKQNMHKLNNSICTYLLSVGTEGNCNSRL